MPFRFSTLLIITIVVIIAFNVLIISHAKAIVCNTPEVDDGTGHCVTPPETPPSTEVWIFNPIAVDTVQGLIDLVLNWLLMIAIPLSTIVILYAAVLFMVSGGDPGRVKKARDVIKFAVIGIVILLLAKGISYSIASFLTP